jgi:2-C-methyl-D-erythritol 2,4-cyclodiphosphate synthase
MRIGLGVDVHRFSDDRPMMLACIKWENARGLAGHSDADVVAHAAADALLSAAGLGDLGSVIGSSDQRWADASGEKILRHIVELLTAHGHQIINVAIQVIGNEPKIAERRSEAEEVLTSIIGAPVSLGATTSDGLGLTGRGEGVAAMATALLA